MSPLPPNTPEKECCCYSSCLTMTLTSMSIITIPTLLMYLLNLKEKSTYTTTTTKPAILTPPTISEAGHLSFKETHNVPVETHNVSGDTANSIISYELE